MWDGKFHLHLEILKSKILVEILLFDISNDIRYILGLYI